MPFLIKTLAFSSRLTAFPSVLNLCADSSSSPSCYRLGHPFLTFLKPVAIGSSSSRSFRSATPSCPAAKKAAEIVGDYVDRLHNVEPKVGFLMCRRWQLKRRTKWTARSPQAENFHRLLACWLV
ncbi:hypothetical protein HPP92_002387 [Vanilla planifolia]|uniref:Uncharacterized protein n=1 Tax=Vanilla planifolia TaxID=51239 RepID=A0A835VIG6_VANPL|nr:hypothetical protein HPP92_002387 [Vanilla planifolia]